LAIAAVLSAASAPFGEWNSWSNNAARTMPVKFDGGNVEIIRSTDAWHAATADTSVVLSILSIDPPHARVVVDGAEEVVTFLIADDTIHLARGGTSHSLRNIVHAPARRAAVAGDGRLVAPMNGRVVAVNAQVGATAAAGTALVVLEAMKMEHVLSVPLSSRVKAVHVAAGAQVSPGQLLVELEAP
jgi:geranyl-CoA carboxylase alpha subunit